MLGGAPSRDKAQDEVGQHACDGALLSLLAPVGIGMRWSDTTPSSAMSGASLRTKSRVDRFCDDSLVAVDMGPHATPVSAANVVADFILELYPTQRILVLYTLFRILTFYRLCRIMVA